MKDQIWVHSCGSYCCYLVHSIVPKRGAGTKRIHLDLDNKEILNVLEHTAQMLKRGWVEIA